MRGISPLISAVLLVAIAVVMTSILFNWGPILIRGQTTTMSNKTDSIVDCNPPLIEDVYMDFQSNISRVYVRGVQGPAEVTDAKLISVTGDEAPLVNSSDVPFNISSGRLKILQYNLTGKIRVCGNFSQVLLTSCISDKFTGTPKCSA